MKLLEDINSGKITDMNITDVVGPIYNFTPLDI